MIKKICILVSNDFTHDPRVKRQAESAVRFGYRTKVLAWKNFEPVDTIPLRESNAYVVLRGIFMPQWGYNKYWRFNLKLAKYNFPYTTRLILFPILRLAKLIFNFFRNVSFFVARLRNYIFRTIRRILVKSYKLIFNFLAFIKKNTFLRHLKIKKTILFLIGKNIEHDKEIPTSQNIITDHQVHQTEIEKVTEMDEVNPKPNIFILMALYINRTQFYLAYYSQMNRFLIKEGIRYSPDIVHANDLDTLWAGWQIKKKTGAKLVYDAHEIWTEQGLQLPKMLLKFYALMECFLFRKVDYFITVNGSIADELKKRYRVGSIPTKVIYNSPRYQVQKFRPVSRQETKILYQGRYSFDRGLEELIEASRYFNRNLKLYFRGTGDEKTQAKLHDMVKKLKSENRVKFLPPVNMIDMVEAATQFDIGVIAYIPVNINNYYCLPNKIYEYMMAGLALAVSDLPELSKIVKENHNGVVFNPKKPKNIAKAINQLAKDINKLNQAKMNSIEAAKLSNWGSEEKKLKEIYGGFTA